MKKSKLYVLVSHALIFAVYNILVWIVMPKDSPNFVVSYIAAVLAFIICVATTLLSDKSGNSRDDAIVKGMPVTIIAIGFLCVQSVFGLVVILLPGVMTKAIVVVEIILFLIFGVIVFGLEAARNYSDEIDVPNDLKANVRTEMISKLQKLYRNIESGEIQSLLIELTDCVKACDGKILIENSEQLIRLINQMQELIAMQQYSQIKDVIKKIKIIL